MSTLRLINGVVIALTVFALAGVGFSQTKGSLSDQLANRNPQKDQANDGKPQALKVEEMAGEWTATKIGEADSSKTKIKIKLDHTGKRLVLEGKYKDWQQEGEFADGKVVFVRQPKAEEMSDKAPKWARDDVYSKGELKWKLELKGERRDNEAHLDGKWFPGELQWRTAKGSHPDLPLPADRQAQYLGPGKPLDVQFKKSVPKLFLYVKCVNGLQLIEDLYVGLPTLVEVQFDPDNKTDEYPITLKSGEQELKLVARKIDNKGIILRTDFFVPGDAKQK